ncbi:nuclear transport factor 2 family protein [Yinghuangia seranimata]|uniref:nuclear transport factor 2 family protein n=1 Tax=Yinghuangia seranimata TaxID=408067 RepID=UPI00248D2598|nr:nuclear transport factor 2 family protein [Yinghuangia seranimata]MDI2126358.1 nuclear transport factor 2 family protein [Yinghuangia seranimata]
MTDAAETRRRNRATLERALAAVGDVPAQMAHYTEDTVFEFPYATPPGRVEGKAVIAEYLTGALKIFSMKLTVTQIHETTDPDVLIAEFTSEGVVTTTGKPYANTYISVVRFRDGLICAQKEFYNPNAATEALTPDE